MFRFMTGTVLVVLLSSSLLFCQPKDAKPTKVTEKDASTTITLTVGDILEVALKENASTGYTWRLGSVDDAILKFKDKKTIPPTTQMMGAPGKMKMTFEAVGPGKAKLRLLSRRGNESSGKTYRLTVEVKAK